MKRYILPKAPILLASLFLASCGGSSAVTESGDSDYIIWAHSDIQPKNQEQKAEYEAAVRDILSLNIVPDMAIVPGDLVYRQESQMYWDWMKELRGRTGIEHWFEIAGNHDLNDRESYYINSGRPEHYAFRTGNVLFIMLSDEIRSAITEISDEAVRWWEDLVASNQDSIVVTVTHACYGYSGFVAAVNWTMTIKNSVRFHTALSMYRVDLWLSGHTHLPNYIGIKASLPDEYGTLFLDVSSIKKHRASPVESWLLVFRENSSVLECMPRNHEKGVFYDKLTVKHRLGRPFKRGSGVPEIVSVFKKP